MATIREMLGRFESVNLRETVPAIIQEQESVLVGYNKEQLQLGFDKEGERLQPYRGLIYSFDKNKMNPKAGFGNPDLKFSGDFYRGFNADVDSKSILIDSSDIKSESLKKKYGENIFGLSKESKSRYSRTEFLQGLKEWIESKTKLKFK